jgi:UDP-hydrolysing UDP-N-acetyl-D-glucosamine 2-epimerase
MKKKLRKILFVINNRANYARIKSVLIECNKIKNIKVEIVAASSAVLNKYGDLPRIIRRDGLKINYKVYSAVEGENLTSMAKSTSLLMSELSTIFENSKPDIVFTIADRYETVAAALSASYMNIFVAHSQGGEITGSIDENVRHCVTKLSHLHFPSTKKSFENLIKLGEEKKRVFMTGCPSIDLIKKNNLVLDKNFFKKNKGLGDSINYKEGYIVVLQHPNTLEYGQGIHQINQTIEAVKKLKTQIVWLWPNNDAGSNYMTKALRIFREKNKARNNFCFFKNFIPEDYLRLISNSSCLVGNSSSFLREGSYLGVPSVCIGTRQAGREHGENVIFADYNSKDIYSKIIFQISSKRYKSRKIFGDGKAGKRIAKILSKIKLDLNKKLNY